MIAITNFFWKKKYYRKKLLEDKKGIVLDFKKVYNQSVLNYVVILNYYRK